jgi:hypothetical protein
MGHKAVVRQLVENDVDQESMDEESHRTPLSWATQEGNEAVVRLTGRI